MTDPVTPLILFCLWTLLLALITVGGRGLSVVLGRRRADGFPPYDYDPGRFLDRSARAYLNALETLPVFASLVFAAYYTGQHDLAITPAIWIVIARMAQSLTHLVGAGHWLVQIRFTFFLVQLALMFFLGWSLLTGWLPY